ncbi:MAG: hypothetical protein ABL984_04590 [Pyrinomonadaceae bacterium]
MAEWHLNELRNAIERSGWRLVAEHPGDNYRISASWKFKRSDKEPALWIDFEGLDDLRTFPIEQSYGCHARNRASEGLYFRRKGSSESVKREIWLRELKAFVSSLNGAE